MKRTFIILFTLCHYFSFGQFSDTTSYHLNHMSTGIINKTNIANSYILNNNLKFNITKKRFTINSSNSWIYGKQQSKLTNNDVSLALDFNLLKTIRHFYYWGIVTYDKSYSLKINKRLQTGLGIGYNVVDKPNVAVVLSDGLLYENGDLYENDLVTRHVYQIFRNSFRLKYRVVIKEIFVLDGINFLQNSLSSEKDYIIKSNTNLSVKLKTWLSFTTSLTYNKINITGRENLLLTFGLTVDKYF